MLFYKRGPGFWLFYKAGTRDPGYSETGTRDPGYFRTRVNNDPGSQKVKSIMKIDPSEQPWLFPTYLKENYFYVTSDYENG